MFKVGDTHPVYWTTEIPGYVNGFRQARILAVQPYRGRYPELFTHVLRLTAPTTKRGYTEMAVKYEPDQATSV